jgi:hypothetical protein
MSGSDGNNKATRPLLVTPRVFSLSRTFLAASGFEGAAKVPWSIEQVHVTNINIPPSSHLFSVPCKLSVIYSYFHPLLIVRLSLPSFPNPRFGLTFHSSQPPAYSSRSYYEQTLQVSDLTLLTTHQCSLLYSVITTPKCASTSLGHNIGTRQFATSVPASPPPTLLRGNETCRDQPLPCYHPIIPPNPPRGLCHPNRAPLPHPELLLKTSVRMRRLQE